VRIREEETVNPKLPTGTVELGVVNAELWAEAQPLPFVLEDGANVREELRLKYRFLDIRRPAMVGNLRFRQRTQRAIQQFLDERDFIEVEPPILTKSNPEGARDYLVPHPPAPGDFYTRCRSPRKFSSSF
jgi:aspartyl-tRNA synthetase